MPRKSRLRNSLPCLLLLLLPGLPSLGRADATFNDSQFHFRIGQFYADYSIVTGPVQISIPTTMELEYENIVSRRRSYTIRSLLAYNQPTNQMFYMAAGVGTRFYLGSSAIGFEASQAGTEVVSMPRWRYFIGPELSIAGALVKGLTSAVTASATILELGISGGLIYQIGQKMGLELILGTGFGYGFSTVSASGVVARGMMGLSFYF